MCGHRVEKSKHLTDVAFTENQAKCPKCSKNPSRFQVRLDRRNMPDVSNN
jgi:hypothetical protein